MHKAVLLSCAVGLYELIWEVIKSGSISCSQ